MKKGSKNTSDSYQELSVSVNLNEKKIIMKDLKNNSEILVDSNS